MSDSNESQAKAGRPSKFNEERAEEACDMAKHGASVAGCARAAGVKTETLRRWLKEHDDFRVTFRRARAAGERRRLEEDSQHARFILARSFKYEETDRKDVTSDGEQIEAGISVTIEDDVINED